MAVGILLVWHSHLLPTLATFATVVWDLSAETSILATDLTGLKAHSLSTVYLPGLGMVTR